MHPSLVHRPGIAAAGGILQSHTLAFRRLWIDSPTLILVESGQKTLRGAAGEFQVRSGEVLALAGGQAFDVRNDPGDGDGGTYRARWLAFERPLLAAWPVRRGGQLPARPVVVLGPAAKQLVMAFGSMLETLADNELPPAIAAHRAQEMLLWVEASGVRLLLDDGERFAPRVRRLLAADPAASWRGPQLAASLALSEASLRRRLADEGTSLTEILLDVRMSNALTLLQSTPWPITRVAGEVGYQSPSQFAIRFRQRFGLAPSDVRRAAEAVAA